MVCFSVEELRQINIALLTVCFGWICYLQYLLYKNRIVRKQVEELIRSKPLAVFYYGGPSPYSSRRLTRAYLNRKLCRLLVRKIGMENLVLEDDKPAKPKESKKSRKQEEEEQQPLLPPFEHWIEQYDI